MMDKGADIFMLDHIDSFYSYLETGDLSTPPAEPHLKPGIVIEKNSPANTC
jgi:hypothetical protein